MNQHLATPAFATPTSTTTEPSTPTWSAFATLVRSRRAVHHFAARPVDPGDVAAILDIARLAPSSFNLQPYTFHWVRTPALREQLATLCLAQSAARSAPELIVCVARWDEWRATSEAHLAWLREREAPAATLRFQTDLYAKMRIFFARGPFNVLGHLRTLAIALAGLVRPCLRPPAGPSEHATWAVKSAALACDHAMLAARARGLDTCPIEGFDAPRVARMLGLRGDSFAIPMILALGYREPTGRLDPQWRRDRGEVVREL